MSDGPFIPKKKDPPKKSSGLVAAGGVAALLAASLLGGDTHVSLEKQQPTTFAAIHEVASLVLPSSPVPLNSLVRIKTSTADKYSELSVLSATGGVVRYSETVQCADGSWVFTGPAGEYTIRLVTFDAETGFSSATGSVTIGAKPTPVPPRPNPTPTPPTPTPPKPTPAPDPVVVVPDGVHGLTKFAFTEAMKVPASDRTKAKSFGDNFSAVAAQIAAGGYLSISDANADLKARNATTLGTARDPWLPWFTSESAKMQELATSGQAKTNQQISECYRAIAEGLKLVK